MSGRFLICEYDPRTSQYYLDRRDWSKATLQQGTSLTRTRLKSVKDLSIAANPRRRSEAVEQGLLPPAKRRKVEVSEGEENQKPKRKYAKRRTADSMLVIEAKSLYGI